MPDRYTIDINQIRFTDFFDLSIDKSIPIFIDLLLWDPKAPLGVFDVVPMVLSPRKEERESWERGWCVLLSRV